MTTGFNRAARAQLGRLENFLDVAYALLFVQMLVYLPRFEHERWVDEPLGVVQLFVDAPTDVLRVVIGSVLTLLYWATSAKLLGPLDRTSSAHAALVLGQVTFVGLFLYFAVADPTLAAIPSTPVAQSLSLLVAGVSGGAGWAYARKHGLVGPELGSAAERELTRYSINEPLTALLTIPLAFVGPLAWSLGWLVLPLLVRVVARRNEVGEQAREPVEHEAGAEHVEAQTDD